MHEMRNSGSECGNRARLFLRRMKFAVISRFQARCASSKNRDMFDRGGIVVKFMPISICVL